MGNSVSYELRREYMFELEKIVRGVGEALLSLHGYEVTDTHDYKGHESSTIDVFARERMQALIDQFLPDFEGIIRLELNPYRRALVENSSGREPLVLIIDEIEGTTNTKRCQAATFDYRPHAGVSMALSTGEQLDGLVASAFYTLDQSEVFSSLSVGDGFFAAFRNRVLINPADVVETRGDSRHRIIVAGYSNSHRKQKGELEQVLYDVGLKVYDGCRASGLDTINLIRNSFDAYVDLRHYWSTKDSEGQEKEAMLQAYDIAGVIPIAAGCGLLISDATGSSWHSYTANSTIPLVVARPGIYQLILQTISPLVHKWQDQCRNDKQRIGER